MMVFPWMSSQKTTPWTFQDLPLILNGNWFQHRSLEMLKSMSVVPSHIQMLRILSDWSVVKQVIGWTLYFLAYFSQVSFFDLAIQITLAANNSGWKTMAVRLYSLMALNWKGWHDPDCLIRLFDKQGQISFFIIMFFIFYEPAMLVLW